MRGAGLRVGDDQRQPVAVRVVESIRDQVRDVEQLPVQCALGHEGQGGLGVDVEVVARRHDAGPRRQSVGTADDDGAPGLAFGAGALTGGDHVTGNQCDGVFAGRYVVRGGRGRRSGGLGGGRGLGAERARQCEYRSGGDDRHAPASVVWFQQCVPAMGSGRGRLPPAVQRCRPEQWVSPGRRDRMPTRMGCEGLEFVVGLVAMVCPSALRASASARGQDCAPEDRAPCSTQRSGPFRRRRLGIPHGGETTTAWP